MKQLILIFGYAFLFSSCALFEEKKVIEACQTAKIQLESDNGWGLLGLAMTGLTPNSTWLDYANMLAQKDPNTKYDWSAQKTMEDGIHLVSFADENGWGHRWEVNLDQQIVRHVNASEYLSRKYGISRLDRSGKFGIIDVTTDTLKLERKNRYSSNDRTMEVVYEMRGSVTNNSDKTLISADISGKLQVIFKDKTLESSKDWGSGFKRKVSKSNPWKPQETLDFHIKAKDIEDIYLQYEPEYVFFVVDVSAEDPVGFKYDKSIKEYNLKHEWSNLGK